MDGCTQQILCAKQIIRDLVAAAARSTLNKGV